MTTAAEAWHVGQERGVRWRGVIWAGHAAMMPVWPGAISCALSTMLLLPPHLLAASKFFRSVLGACQSLCCAFHGDFQLQLHVQYIAGGSPA